MTTKFDPEKVERTKWVDYGYDGWAFWPDIPENEGIRGDGAVIKTVASTDYDQLLARFRKLETAARFALDGCVDLIGTEEGHALEDALGLERS